MSDFTPYPGPPATGPGSPEDRYVVAVTCSVQQGMLAPQPVTGPMSYAHAQQLLARVASGEPSELLTDEVDLVAEVAPGHLVAARTSSFFRQAATYDIRIARVLFSR